MTASLMVPTTHRASPSIDDCAFYHSMTIPGHGEVKGEWDLRGREKEYLGNIDLAGKKVLEIGTASGHLCFWMEQQGADVTGYDLSEKQEWDIVPYHDYDYTEHVAREERAHPAAEQRLVVCTQEVRLHGHGLPTARSTRSRQAWAASMW